jgi:hypothetical protein
MAPRPPLKPGIDPTTGLPLPKGRHAPAHAQGATHTPQIRTLPPSALEVHEKSLQAKPTAPQEAVEEIQEISDDMILQETDITKVPVKIVTQKRKDLGDLLREIEIAPKKGISQAISFYRQTIAEAARTPENQDIIYNAIEERAARLREVEASLEPSDRVALNFFIDLTLKGLKKSEKKASAEKPATLANPIKHASNLRELLTVVSQLLEDANTPEEKKDINRQMAQRAVELALESKKVEEWSDWGNNLLTFLPEFQKKEILTAQEAAKHFERFIGYGVQKIKDMTSLIESLNWIREIKKQIEAGEKAGMMGSDMTQRAILYVNQLQANLRGR